MPPAAVYVHVRVSGGENDGDEDALLPCGRRPRSGHGSPIGLTSQTASRPRTRIAAASRRGPRTRAGDASAGTGRRLSPPGHTLGHQSLLLALDGRELLLTADAAYTRRTIDEDLVPIFFADEQLYVRSLAQLREHVRATPDAVVIPGHDAQLWPRLHAVYA